jgi:hypothetical protein
VPEVSSEQDVARARQLFLDELLADFTFVSPTDRAHALAVALEPFVRELIEGCLPMHGIESPIPGSGKDLLAAVLMVAYCGRRLATTPLVRDDEELRKKLTAIFMEAPPAILFGNVTRLVNSPVLDDALTKTLWKDRLLGHTRLVVAPILNSWLLTGNNPRYSKDSVRRVVRSRLNPDTEQPWLKTEADFRHPDLLRWAVEHRGELVWAALVFVRSWLAAGQPEGHRTLGSYESWAKVIGGILEHQPCAWSVGSSRARPGRGA